MIENQRGLVADHRYNLVIAFVGLILAGLVIGIAAYLIARLIVRYSHRPLDPLPVRSLSTQTVERSLCRKNITACPREKSVQYMERSSF